MNRTLRHVLLALALLFSQQAAQLHAFSHFKHDLAAAQGDRKSTPPVGHPVEQCLAFHAIGSVLPGMAQPVIARCAAPLHFAGFSLSLPFAPQIVFDSRAPPSHS
ncbi:MAG: hypothetical protein A3H35_06850 [Betaproteobacteria bacterium RIFCSPLOWO2_02_FULL_62_17]|nr:MAG: hypothetical protein A3H35_06850 [Betaproteobacteria bacterium RIFCSPLOWO2_02_FULL_62_17]